MRFLAAMLAALMIAAVQPAWAFRETLPGDEYWPEIPGRMGMRAFLQTWTPLCNHGAFTENGDMTIHADGRISYGLEKPYLPIRYRVIEETPHYVVTLARTSEPNILFWAFRPLGKSHPRFEPGMRVIGLNECPIYGDSARKRDIWNFTDAELAEFWRSNTFCHPALTEKHDLIPYWGGRWNQPCYYER